jgi:hypothetical protein
MFCVKQADFALIIVLPMKNSVEKELQFLEL